MAEKYLTVDQYLAAAPEEIRERLQALRNLMGELLPGAEETMAYGLATWRQGKNVVHFGYFKHHTGLFPTPSGIEAFAEELKEWQTSTGSIQMPHDRDLPWDLIRRLVEFRRDEVAAEMAAKARKPRLGAPKQA